MRIPVSVLTVMLTALLLPVHAASIAGPGPVHAVDAFHAALKAGDREDALTLLADDATIYEEGEAELGKAEYAKASTGR